MAETALVFPGQGSQVVGMGRDLYHTSPAARAVFDEADEVLGMALSRICFEGPTDALTDTVNQQPALLTASIAVLRVLEERGCRPVVAFMAGHSLGEYSALVAAGALRFPDAVLLVRERGRAMKAAGERAPGGMAAVLGLADDIVDDICRAATAEVGGMGVVCANYNAPGQVVISGERVALERASALARERGAKRVIPLPITIASHSPLMGYAQELYGPIVEGVPLRRAAVPIIANTSAGPVQGSEEMRRELISQLTSPVRWTASVRYMVARGVTRFLEIGPKDVLAGLIRRIAPEVAVLSIGDMAGIEAFCAV